MKTPAALLISLVAISSSFSFPALGRGNSLCDKFLAQIIERNKMGKSPESLNPEVRYNRDESLVKDFSKIHSEVLSLQAQIESLEGRIKNIRSLNPNNKKALKDHVIAYLPGDGGKNVPYYIPESHQTWSGEKLSPDQVEDLLRQRTQEQKTLASCNRHTEAARCKLSRTILDHLDVRLRKYDLESRRMQVTLKELDDHQVSDLNSERNRLVTRYDELMKKPFYKDHALNLWAKIFDDKKLDPNGNMTLTPVPFDSQGYQIEDFELGNPQDKQDFFKFQVVKRNGVKEAIVILQPFEANVMDGCKVVHDASEAKNGSITNRYYYRMLMPDVGLLPQYKKSVEEYLAKQELLKAEEKAPWYQKIFGTAK